jgi:hypothetical protein
VGGKFHAHGRRPHEASGGGALIVYGFHGWQAQFFVSIFHSPLMSLPIYAIANNTCGYGLAWIWHQNRSRPLESLLPTRSGMCHTCTTCRHHSNKGGGGTTSAKCEIGHRSLLRKIETCILYLVRPLRCIFSIVFVWRVSHSANYNGSTREAYVYRFRPQETKYYNIPTPIFGVDSTVLLRPIGGTLSASYTWWYYGYMCQVG